MTTLTIPLSSLTLSPFSKRVPTRSLTPELCVHFTRFGTCKHSSSCRFIHDLGCVQLCRNHLRGVCNKGDCPLSHERDKSRTPECQRWLQNKCPFSAEDCVYLHVKKSPNAVECQAFREAYCCLGRRCPLRHVMPQTSDAIGVKRKRTEPAESTTEEDEASATLLEEERMLEEAWIQGKDLQWFL
jgi:hypothetical protein